MLVPGYPRCSCKTWIAFGCRSKWYLTHLSASEFQVWLQVSSLNPCELTRDLIGERPIDRSRLGIHLKVFLASYLCYFQSGFLYYSSDLLLRPSFSFQNPTIIFMEKDEAWWKLHTCFKIPAFQWGLGHFLINSSTQETSGGGYP